MTENFVSRNRGRFHFMFVSPASKHGAGTFWCLVPIWLSFLALAKFLSSLAWTNNHEDYSFLLDHLSVISRFLSNAVLTLAVFAALRLALNFAYRKISIMSAAHTQNKEDEKDGLPRWRVAALAKFCAFSIHALNVAYGIALALLLFLFAHLSWAYYSPLLFYRHYRNEPFRYSFFVFFVVSGLGVLTFILAALFRKQRRLKAGRNMLRGDMTGAFSYEPLLCLPERMKLFDGTVSWEERTGLSFKSLWCVSYAIRLIPWMILAGCGMLLLSTSLYVVEPHREALLYRLGALQQHHSVKGPGLYFKLPWPVDRVDIYDVSRVRNMQIGYIPSSSRDYLWNSAHGGKEYTLLSGGGNEMIAVNLQVSYRIRNLYDYATRYANPENLLSSKVYEMMMQKTMSSDLNTMLSVDRKELSEALTEELSQYASTLASMSTRSSSRASTRPSTWRTCTTASSARLSKRKL
ncbi:MAG: hypothetical protein LBS00_07975 [Synergistaceae bacterium]|jgi:hypothetical protein|nr:hypothetical protein [Synergistaceae bacterium]